jgi:hypothetical protein
MKEYKNIDEVFRNGLDGMKVEPSRAVWSNIEAGFFQTGAFVWKWYHISALLLLLAATGGFLYYYFGMPDKSASQVVTEDQDRGNQQGDAEQTSVISIQDESPVEELPPNQVTESSGKPDLTVSLPTASATEENQTSDEDVVFSESIFVVTESQEGYSRFEDFDGMDKRTIPMAETPNVSIDPVDVPGMEEYLKKKGHTRFYTGAVGHAGMMYYPSTKDQFTWSADLAFGLKVGKFYIETGIGYEFMQERGVYLIELQSYDSIGYYNRVNSFEVNPFKPDEILYNTSQVAVFDSVSRYTHTTPLFKYHYVQIPLTFGYRFVEQDRLTISVNTGIIYNHLTRSEVPSADYTNPDYTIIGINDVTPERVDWNLRWQVALRLNYRVAKSLSLAAEPVFTKHLNSIYNTDLGYPNVKPYTMGVRIGVYYGF